MQTGSVMATTEVSAIDGERPEHAVSDPVILADTDLDHVSTDRVRLYCRLAAGIPAFLMVISPILIDWALHAFFDIEPGSIWIVIPSVLLVLFGIWTYIKGELRLRSYHLLLSEDGVIFEFGRARTRLLFEHVQLMDRETSLFLGKFRLIRLNLYTAGGMVALSPVPVDVARTIEQILYSKHVHVKADV
jgi:membrane protein YdbS with pleckstrin-like domain